MRAKVRLMSALLLMMLISPSLASAEKESTSITFNEPVMIAGMELEAGRYRIKWDNSVAPDVQVSFEKNGKTIATVPARIVDFENPYDSKTVETRTEGDNLRVLQEIRLKKIALMFDQSVPGS
jgi:hypothetical protein